MSSTAMFSLRPEPMLVGLKEPRTPRMSHVPSYMQPTRSSRLKENLYGTEFKFVPKKVTKEPSLTPKMFGMDYIPRADPPPGLPSFMRQTSTSKVKVASQVAKSSRARPVQRKKSNKVDTIKEFHMFRESNVIVNKFEAMLESISFYPTSGQDTGPPTPLHEAGDQTMEKRRKSYSYVTPNPVLLANRDGRTSPMPSARYTEKVKAIQTAPPEDSAREYSSESHFSVSDEISTRPPAIPRYMRPTTASSARVRH